MKELFIWNKQKSNARSCQRAYKLYYYYEEKKIFCCRTHYGSSEHWDVFRNSEIQ